MKQAYKKLKIPTKRWVKKVKSEWQLDEHHERLLLLSAQAWDRAQDAKTRVDTDGSVIKDRFDQLKTHPAVEIERQAMLTFARLLCEIGLDLEQPEDPRPPYRPGGYN